MNWKLGSHEKKQGQNNSQLVKKFQYKDWGYGIIDVFHTDVPFDYFSNLGIFDKNTISEMTGGSVFSDCNQTTLRISTFVSFFILTLFSVSYLVFILFYLCLPLSPFSQVLPSFSFISTFLLSLLKQLNVFVSVVSLHKHTCICFMFYLSQIRYLFWS